MAKEQTESATAVAEKETKQLLLITIDGARPRQTRLALDEITVDSKLMPSDEFVKSIAASNGALEPIIVVEQGDKYKLLEGRRRVAAHRMLVKDDDGGKAFATIAAVVFKAGELNPAQMAAITYRMNKHRSDNPIAELRAIETIMKSAKTDDTGDIAKLLGTTRRQVQRILMLRNLEPELQKTLAAGGMTLATALKASKLDPADQAALVEESEGERVSEDAVKAMTAAPAVGLDGLFGEDVTPNVTTEIAGIIARLAELKTAAEGDDATHMQRAIAALECVGGPAKSKGKKAAKA